MSQHALLAGFLGHDNITLNRLPVQPLNVNGGGSEMWSKNLYNTNLFSFSCRSPAVRMTMTMTMTNKLHTVGMTQRGPSSRLVL